MDQQTLRMGPNLNNGHAKFPFTRKVHEKRILHEKRRFGTGCRETVITNAVLSQNDVKRILHQKHRFGTRFTETVITNTVLSQNGFKTHFVPKTSFWH